MSARLAPAMLLWLSATATSQAPAPPPVTLGLAVTNDGQDRYVDDLTTADIRVVEDGRPQAVTALRTVRRPVSVCVVFDASSGDDQPAKRRVADATIRALAQSLDPRDEIAVLEMLTAPDVRLPLTPAGDVTTMRWSDARQRGWGLDETMLAALDVLDRARHPRRVVLLLTDGLGGGRQVLLSNLVTTRFRSETTVHAIEMVMGMPPDYGPGYMPVRDRRIVKPAVFDSPVRTREPDPALERVVVEGGGLLQRIGDASEAEQAVRNVVNDLRFEYTLEYTPTLPEDGRFHRVTVEMTRRGARARHRAGYLAVSPGVRTTTTVALPAVESADDSTAPPRSAVVVVAPVSTTPPAKSGSAAATRAALRSTYEAAVESFRSTRSFAGAEGLVGAWSRETLEAAVTAARRNDRAFAFAASLFHLEVALDVAPRSADNARYHLDLGETLLEALPHAETDHDVHDFLSRWYATASSMFLAQTDGQRAKEIANRAARKVPNSSRVQFVMGRIEELQAMTIDADYTRLDKSRGRLALQRRAGLAVAEEQYRKALALEPGYVKAQVYLGGVLLELDHRDEGRRLLEPIAGGATHAPGDRYLARLFLARDYERAGDVDRARAKLEGIDAVAPGRQTGWLALAQLEQRAGRVDRAREIVAAHLGAASDVDEWWAFRRGGLEVEDLSWLRAHIAR
jgi:VWFA-related protein